MRVFLSWSGEASKHVAQVLHDWLPRVIQSVRPWLSSEDIDKGSRWLLELGKTLEDGAYGIVCVTSDNVHSPWVAFEAGALAKQLDDSRVSPFLVGIGPSDVTGPLSQFQSTIHSDKEDVARLLKGINASLKEPLAPDVLADAIHQRWDQLQEKLAAIPAPAVARPTRSDRAVLDELLELVRGMERRLGPSEARATAPGSSLRHQALREVRDRTRVEAVQKELASRGIPLEAWRIERGTLELLAAGKGFSFNPDTSPDDMVTVIADCAGRNEPRPDPEA